MRTAFSSMYKKSHNISPGILALAFAVFLSILLCTSVAFALDITLAWDATSGADGYRVFYREDGQSYNYLSPAWEGDATTCTIYGLDDSTIYHFVARAYNAEGESGNSNEVTHYSSGSNQPPVLNPIGSKSVNEAVLISFTISASDPDNDAMTFSASNVPSGASFNPSSRVFSWTPAYGDAGNYHVTFTVTDNGTPAESDSETVTITVGNVNRPPVLGTIGSRSVDEGNSLTFTVTASDPDNDGLTFSASNVPSGASFNPSTHVFSWTPAIGDAGNYNVQFTVTDNGSPPETDLEIVAITVVDPSAGNLAPAQPVIISPYNGEMETDLLLTVETEPFSDSDGDTHQETKWQIVKEEDSSLVLEIVSNERLTKLPVPHAVLDRHTTYNVRVQFVDSHSEASLWSDPVEFTTHNGEVDYDGDGVPDDNEVDNTVDLNEDGTPDNDQPDVIKSALSAVAGKKPLGINKISASIDSIELLEPIHPSEILDKKNKPKNFMLGLAAYRLKVSQVGATTQVKVYYSEDISQAAGYYVYDTVNGWRDYGEHVTFNPDGRSVTVELKDGGEGDSDGVANGIIVDPGGVVGSDGVVGSVGGLDSGAGGGCFIATAKHTDRHDWLEPVVRVLLVPLVGINYTLMRASLATSILLGFLAVVSILGWYGLIYRRRKYLV